MTDPRELPEWLQLEVEAREAEHRATRRWVTAIALTVILGACGGWFAITRLFG